MSDRNLERLLRASSIDDGAVESTCADEAIIAGYVDGRLSDEDRERLERHLVDCGECIRLVSFLSRTAELPSPRPIPEELGRQARQPSVSRPNSVEHQGARARRWLAMAAGLLLVTSVVMWNLPGDDGYTGTTETRYVDPGALGPKILSPVADSTVPLDSLLIRWTPEPPSLFYEVRVVSGDGDLIWRGRVEGTQVILPLDLRLADDESYFVRVSAYLPGGKTLRSEHVGFRVRTVP